MGANKLGPGNLKFGNVGDEVEFATRCRKIEIGSKVDEDDPRPVLSGDELPGDSTETFTLAATIMQEYDESSAVGWSWTNAGKFVPFTFTPDADKGMTVKGIVRVQRITIGGEVKKANETDFEWTCKGTPSLLDTAGEAWAYSPEAPAAQVPAPGVNADEWD